MHLGSVQVTETVPGLWMWYALSLTGEFVAHSKHYTTSRAAMDAAINVFDLTTRGIPIYVRHPRLA